VLIFRIYIVGRLMRIREQYNRREMQIMIRSGYRSFPCLKHQVNPSTVGLRVTPLTFRLFSSQSRCLNITRTLKKITYPSWMKIHVQLAILGQPCNCCVVKEWLRRSNLSTMIDWPLDYWPLDFLDITLFFINFVASVIWRKTSLTCYLNVLQLNTSGVW
jgi:hypothetical protein